MGLHPQGRTVATLPLMEITRIGDSPSEALPEGDRPLSGVRVLDLIRVLAGPTCARTVSEQGADVYKISALHIPYIAYQEYAKGLRKLSAHIDLRETDQRDTFFDLIKDCDVFSQGYRPGTLADRGLSPD